MPSALLEKVIPACLSSEMNPQRLKVKEGEAFGQSCRGVGEREVGLQLWGRVVLVGLAEGLK